MKGHKFSDRAQGKKFKNQFHRSFLVTQRVKDLALSLLCCGTSDPGNFICCEYSKKKKKKRKKETYFMNKHRTNNRLHVKRNGKRG